MLAPWLSALLLGACGGSAEPAAHPEPPVAEANEADAIESGDREIVDAKLAEARKALEAGQPRKARHAAEEARRAAGQAELSEVLAVVDKIDAQEGLGIAAEVRQLAAGRQCQDALATVASILKRTPPPGRMLVDTLQSETEAALVACLRVDLDEMMDAGDFDKARALLSLPNVTTALRDKAWKALVGTLHAGIARSVADEVRADINAGRYDEAARKLDLAKQAGALGAGGHGGGVVEHFQTLFKEPLLAKIASVLDHGKGDPKAVLEELDSITALLGWELPQDLATARRALAIFAECKLLRCALSKPEHRWTYGSVGLAPSDASSGAAVKSVPSARKVFVVARAGAHSLVMLDEPKSDLGLRERLLGAAGWAKTDQLKGEDTVDWLLPGSEIVGQRVFGPFREPSRDYYLGVVTASDGDRVSVKRLSDESVVTVSRASLRSGRMPSGTKVLAYCSNPLKMEMATVEREVPQSAGLPLVRIVCSGDGKGASGPARDEVPGAIVSKAEWLPKRKP